MIKFYIGYQWKRSAARNPTQVLTVNFHYIQLDTYLHVKEISWNRHFHDILGTFAAWPKFYHKWMIATFAVYLDWSQGSEVEYNS